MQRLEVLLLAALLGLPVSLAAQNKPSIARITVPGSPGALELVQVGDFEQRVRPDGKETQVQTREPKTGLNISAFLQRVDFKPSPSECRKRWWAAMQQSPQIRRENIRLSQNAEMARVEYDVPVFQGMKVDQHSVHAYMGGGSECAEVHLSILRYEPSKAALFDFYLQAVRFIADAPASPSKSLSQLRLSSRQQPRAISNRESLLPRPQLQNGGSLLPADTRNRKERSNLQRAAVRGTD